MKIDYISGEHGPGRSLRRVVLISSLCAVGLAALVSHDTLATRRSSGAAGTGAASDALAGTPNYEEAIQAALADPLEVPSASDWVTVTVRSGQSLSNIFSAEGLAPEEWMALLKLGGDCLQLKRLNVGEQLQLRKEGDELEELRYALDETRTLLVHRTEDGFEAETLTATLEHKPVHVGGTIRNSLFVDAQRAGLTDRMIMDLAEVFRYDVDFALDLREGDHFSVVFDEYYKDGKRVRVGDILAAEFVNQGKVYRAVRHTDEEGRIAYYTPEGQSLKKAFIRTPLDVVRISSPFNLKRRHPILNTIRAHKGVDYAAASGTPIKAAGDGKVAFVGNKNGYGKVVVLKHGSQYETLYAHMSRFKPGLAVGSRVDQGQVIGYVGSTGLATAPHLHFEFHVNGNYVNPVTVALPRANPLDRNQMAAFKAKTSPLLAQLDGMPDTQTAAAEPPAIRQAPPIDSDMPTRAQQSGGTPVGALP